MEREDLRLYAAGHFAQTNRKTALDVEKMDKYVEGAIFAFDLITSIKRKSTWVKQDQQNGVSSNGTEVRET